MMTASGSRERVKRPRRCSHRNCKSPSQRFPAPSRQATRPCANRACWESRRRHRPARGGRAPGQRRPTNHARSPALAIRPHPQLGEIRHDACAGCEGLWGKRRRHRAHYPGRLSSIRPLGRSGIALGSTVIKSTRECTAPDARSRRFAHPEPDIRNLGRAGRPPITQRPPGSVSSRAVGEAKKTNDLPEPGTRSGSTRRQQSFELLEPEAGVARPLVELDPRYALIPQVGSQHGALHSACAPGRSRGGDT